jgi:hypothetical protein
MNLAERRVVNDFETNQYPALKKRIEEAAGFAVPVEVRWDTLVTAGESRLWAETWPAIYFESLIGGLESVTKDAMGKEAVKEKLKKIVIQNTKGIYYGDRWATFENGVLTLDHDPVTNAGSGEERERGLATVLENAL